MAEDVFEGLAAADGKEPPLGGMLIKDGALVVVALAVWGGADTWAAQSGLWLALATAVGASMVVGWIVAGLLHEWGHYAGAKLAGAVAPRVQPSGLAFFRYNFDLKNNNRRQFTAMSVGGSVAHWSAVVAAFLLLPMSTLAQTVLVSTTFAFAVFATVIEWPIIARTLSGRVHPAEAFGHIDQAFIRRHYVIGGAGGLLFFAFAGSPW